MSKTLLPLREVKAALKSVKAESYARGVEAGRAEATRMLEFAVRLNGHGPRTLKAIHTNSSPQNIRCFYCGSGNTHGARTDGTANRSCSDCGKLFSFDYDTGETSPRAERKAMGEVPEQPDAQPPAEDLILLAYCEALEEAKEHHPDGDGGTIAEYLRGLLHDPEEAAAFVAEGGGSVTNKAIINGKKKYGCLMADLPPELATQIRKLGSMIPDSDLGEDGREGTPHVTVRYGFHDGVKASDVASIVETWEEPLRIRLNHPECFYGKDSGKPYDVIVFLVESEQLHYLHNALGELPHTDTHAEYRPHATVAYVKAGLGDKWLKRMQIPTDEHGMELRSAVLDSLVYSDAYRNKTNITLSDPVLFKAFDESKHPRGDDGRFIGREAIHAAKSDPAKAEALRARTTDPAERAKLDAALEGKEDLGRTKAGLHKEKVEQTKKEKAERLQKVRTLAEEISMARRGGQEVPPEHFTELAEHLPHLTVDQLRSVRTSLAASFWGRTRRDDMVTALVRHAKVKAEQLRAEQAADDPLDFSIEAMSNTGGTGHADAGRSELNPWREFDKDKSYSEAQHGGRMEQRKQVMNATDAPGKTSAGTPDTGSVLKVPGKVADEQLTQKLQAEPATKQVTQDKPGERGGNWGDSLEPSDGISTPMTKEEFIAQEIRKLREEYPGNDDETYQAQAELNAMDWKPPPEKGKYEVGETVSVDGELGSYRGTFTGKDGNKYAVIASAKGGQYSIPVDKVERGKFEIVGTGDEPKPTFKPQQTPAESRRAAKRLRDEQASRPANKSHKYTDEELAAMEAEDLAADAAPATDTPAPATLKQPSQESRNNAPPASEVGGPFAASSVKGAASAPTGWVGDDLLLINHAYRHLKNTDPAYKDMTLDQFKDQLIRENGKGVTLSRADLPQALDPNDVRESQAQHPAMRGRHGGDFHFIKVPRASSGQKEIPEETGVSGADAPKASNIPPVASDSSGAEQPNQSGFNPEAAVRVAADDITKLRKSDVFRVVEWSPPESRAAVAEYISQHRPDLHGELSEVVNELGVAAPQNGSKTSTGGTFSDNDFSNGNTHEKKIGPASLQYGVNENTGRIELYSLRVPGSHRRKGAAKEAMKAFLAEADQRGLPVELLASPLDKKTNLGKLVNFYQSLGFEVIGRGNPAGDPKMLRKPQPTLAKSFSALSWSALRDELQVAYDAPPG